MSENLTLHYYNNNNSESYASTTVNADMSGLCNEFLKLIPDGEHLGNYIIILTLRFYQLYRKLCISCYNLIVLHCYKYRFLIAN